jgi:hypothetical protein
VNVTCDWLARIPAFLIGYLNLEYGTNTLSLNVGRNIPDEQSAQFHSHKSPRTTVNSLCYVTTPYRYQIPDTVLQLQADKGSLALFVLHGKNNGNRASCQFHKSEVKCNIQMKQRKA